MSNEKPISDFVARNLLAEYDALRNEITTRLKIQTEMLAFMIGALAVLFGVGFSYNRVNEILVIIPFLTLSAGFHYAWVISMVHAMGQYIREEIEPRLKGMEWQKYYRSHRFKSCDVEHSYSIGIAFSFIIPTFISIIAGIIYNFVNTNPIYLTIEFIYIIPSITLTHIFWVVIPRGKNIFVERK